ncbi:MAG: hypothetical protein EOO04_38215 [Chitinophagaceae bacterium]|nr:MAG: hypothetical protein EOO04_38215 [Chitinophagaceae bacterium]
MKEALTNTTSKSRFDPSFCLLASYVISSIERRFYNSDILFVVAMLGFAYTIILSVVKMRKSYIEDGTFLTRRQGWFLFCLILSAVFLFLSLYARQHEGFWWGTPES